MPPRLELLHVTKRYADVVANDDVSLVVQADEIHAVLGENGAGKSTLMKIAYGAVRPDAGEIRWNGRRVEVRNPQAARALGIAMVFQHFSLFDALTVAENISLGLNDPGGMRRLSARIAEVAARYGLEVDPGRQVHRLSVGERQRVEILRALLTDPQLLILDEPTSVLTPQAVQALFATLRRLAASGCSILYISHKLDEIQSLCHRCTVLRAGRVSAVVDPRQETTASLSRLMIGAEPPAVMQHAIAPGAPALSVRSLTRAPRDRFGVALRAVSFTIRRGEIVGIAGVSGNGQQELLEVLSGEELGVPADCMHLFGEPVGALPARLRRARGLRFVPEERLGRGAVPGLALSDNVLLTHHDADVLRGGWVRRGALRARAERIVRAFGVKTSGVEAAARSLSGGNLQKFIVGREIEGRPAVLIVAQPTWGVDVGAAAQLRNALLGLRDAGSAVLVVSEDLDELFQITDRLLVMAKGRVSPSVATREVTVEQVGQWMSGLWPAALEEGVHAA